MIPMRSLRPWALALLSAAAACGGEAESAAPTAETPAAAVVAEPWTRIPPDSLYGATPAENLRLTPVELDVARLPTGWEGIRIAAISDLHLGLWEGNEQVAAAAVRRAMAANPDLIVLLGDYVDEEADTAALARVLGPLRGRQVLAVLGDRDVRSDSLEAAVRRTLRAAGIPLLVNEAVPVTRGGSTAQVGGIDPELGDESWGDQEWVLSTLGGGGETPLLLSHLPPLVSRAPDDRFAAALAGNTFCGKVEVPGSPRLGWLNTEALPGAVVEGAERLYRVAGATLFVTCGVGYGFVPTRLGFPPEVALVTLRGPGAPAAAEAVSDSAALDTLLRRYQGGDTTGAGGAGG